ARGELGQRSSREEGELVGEKEEEKLEESSS
ncbi:hypothetical protein A2U01_0092910, partial [Trifolium medium]|nr:hypothetical protein [Trifolium medium]